MLSSVTCRVNVREVNFISESFSGKISCKICTDLFKGCVLLCHQGGCQAFYFLTLILKIYVSCWVLQRRKMYNLYLFLNVEFLIFIVK